MSTCASPVPYFGGKALLAARIVELFPVHGHYVEPCCGSLAVLLAKAPSVMETVNDLDARLMTFWRVLREQPAALARAAALTPHSRAEFDSCDDLAGCDELEVARRVHVQLTQGRGAVGVRSGWRHYIAPAGTTGLPDYLRGYLDRIAPAAERLQHVSLESRPALEVITRYGRHPDVLRYVDPPYLASARGTGNDPRGGTRRYRHELLDEAGHAELAEALLGCAAAVVLSGYPSPLYERCYAGWERREFRAGTGQSARGLRSSRTEVVWSNRQLPARPPTLFDTPEPRP